MYRLIGTVSHPVVHGLFRLDARGLERLAKIFVESIQELRSTTENAGEAPASVKQ